jgi:hypothetical protein
MLENDIMSLNHDAGTAERDPGRRGGLTGDCRERMLDF